MVFHANSNKHQDRRYSGRYGQYDFWHQYDQHDQQDQSTSHSHQVRLQAEQSTSKPITAYSTDKQSYYQQPSYHQRKKKNPQSGKAKDQHSYRSMMKPSKREKSISISRTWRPPMRNGSLRSNLPYITNLGSRQPVHFPRISVLNHRATSTNPCQILSPEHSAVWRMAVLLTRSSSLSMS